MASLHSLPSVPPSEGFEEVMAELQRRHAAGELSAMFVVTVDRDGCPDELHTRVPNYCMMLGAIERGKHQLIAEAEE